ncbi:MAG: signal recognition particle receptor subunit alpha, partial [Marmoricola sp.]
MTTIALIILLAVGGVVLAGLVGLVALTRRRPRLPAPPWPDGPVITGLPEASTDPESTDPGTVDGIPPAAATTTLERPESTASRLVRLRQRLAGSQGGLGRGLLALLSRDRIDEDTWESIEDTLLTADVGVG